MVAIFILILDIGKWKKSWFFQSEKGIALGGCFKVGTVNLMQWLL